MIERQHLQVVRSRIAERRKFIQVVVGPRQVGKTTMINQLLSKIDIPYLFEAADGVAAGNTTWLSQIWESTRMKMKLAGSTTFLLVIDEVQKIENWSEIIKQQWDKDTNNDLDIKLILLGSSRLLIQKGLTESLAGRFETIYMGHWSFAEMESAFDWSVEQYIYFGGYPGSATLISDEPRWKNYINDSLIETSISKDILMLTRVDKPALLKRLFELGSAYSGQIVSFTKILGKLQDKGNTTTLSYYLKLLSDSGLLGGIEKYAGSLIREKGSIPKFQVFNNALLNSQTGDSFDVVKSNPKTWGRLVESAIGSHLINQSITERYSVFYWRERNEEVDFVIQQNSNVIALEVKSGRRGENKGLSTFSGLYHPLKALIVGTNGISIEEFLRMNSKDLF
ncbi:MAG: AAA family ATPase [Mariniphaga sp.]